MLFGWSIGVLFSFLLIIINIIQCSCTYFAVEQCPGTDVPIIRHQSQFNEISVIFYYTQWSDESLEALQEYYDVAEYYGDKLYFAAIDCWHLACNCSKTLTTVAGSGTPHKWPTLMVHYGQRGQLKIQYNGLFKLREMIQFIENVMHPLERVESRDDLNKLKPLTDAIVLGVFEKPEDLEYRHYLRAAQKWLEHDPIRAFRFTVTFATIKDINLNDTKVRVPNLLLQTHKTKKSFADYHDFKWNTSNILHWLNEELNDDYSQLHGYSTPIMIGQKMKKQAILSVFLNQPQQFFTYIEKYVDAHESHTNKILACNKSIERNIVKNNWKKSLQFSKILKHIHIFSDSFSCHYYNRWQMLKSLNIYYEINQYLTEHYETLAYPVKFQLFYNPQQETHELLDFFDSTSCMVNKDISLQNSLHISTVKWLEDYLRFEQQQQNSNRTLTAVLLDTKRYKDYLENLDIVPNTNSMATVFLIDNEKESTYLMEEPFAINSLKEFVKKFFSNRLNNFYKNKENIPTTLARSPENLHSFSSSLWQKEYDFELNHLSRYIFLNYLQNTHNQTLIVLLYSPDCALCGNIQHTFMQLSLSLRQIMDLKFIRINVMDNDLPWQYNMPNLPALLVFPENRFSESRLFPMHLKPDIRNVFGFILSHLKAHQQVRLVLAVCQSGTLPTGHLQSCWQFAKTILMQHIGKHLQYWQMFEAERSLIFERLRAFKDMSLDIQRNLRL